MNNLNQEELVWGFVYGICFMPFIGEIAILVAILCSLLWALGGRYGHSIRVFGVPIISYGALWVVTHHGTCIASGVLTALVLSIGYGIPSKQPLDSGSALGKFWYSISEEYANILTRATIVILLVLSFVPSLF